MAAHASGRPDTKERRKSSLVKASPFQIFSFVVGVVRLPKRSDLIIPGPG